MNEEKAPELPALTQPLPAARQQRVSGAQPLALWLAILALAGIAGLSWLAWQSGQRIESTRQELSRRLADSVSAQQEALAHAKQNREALDALQAKVGAFEAQLAEMQSQQIALQSMYQDLSRVRDDRLLAEIEQDVAIAAQQLQLAGNVEAALIALQGAEARLAKSAQPQFLGLRKLIVRDLERLKALPGADVTGIALRLDTLLNAVPGLPLAFEQRPKEGPPSPSPSLAGGETVGAVPPAPTFAQMIRTWLGELWHELRQLVRIERIDTQGIGDPGLLAPREVFFLRENLRLRLLSARLALLARDGHSFQSDLKQAEQWLGHYFDRNAPAVQDAQVTLRGLIKLDVMREPVELNETLSALRNFKLARDKR
jgi:uroporphyrin-3 C-methyltransferase